MTTPERQTETVLASSRPRVSIGRIVVLLISLFCLYLLFPKLAEVFEAWDSLGKVDPVWIPAIAAAEFASFGCVWALQRIALRGASWFVVVTTQLAGNAFNRITPLGGATGTAFQARMLADAGVPLATAASAMTVASILGSGALGTLPLFTLPLLVLTGTEVPHRLLAAAWIGIAVFVALASVLALLLWTRKPLAWIGGSIDAVASRLRRRPRSDLGDRLVAERNEIRRVLGSHWIGAIGTSIGRWLFEYLTLLFTLVAIGASPDPALTLLAFTIAELLSLVPLTPGGLGFVELGLVGTLVAAGVDGQAALLATLVFRLVSFWLPLPLGLAAAYLFRRRYPRQTRSSGNGQRRRGRRVQRGSSPALVGEGAPPESPERGAHEVNLVVVDQRTPVRAADGAAFFAALVRL